MYARVGTGSAGLGTVPGGQQTGTGGPEGRRGGGGGGVSEFEMRPAPPGHPPAPPQRPDQIPPEFAGSLLCSIHRRVPISGRFRPLVRFQANGPSLDLDHPAARRVRTWPSFLISLPMDTRQKSPALSPGWQSGSTVTPTPSRTDRRDHPTSLPDFAPRHRFQIRYPFAGRSDPFENSGKLPVEANGCAGLVL